LNFIRRAVDRMVVFNGKLTVRDKNKGLSIVNLQ
jgi:hypothetical protein